MERLKFYKVNYLPQNLEKNAIYFVKKQDNKFDLYITDNTGTIVYSLNGIDNNNNNLSQDLTNYFSYVNYIKNTHSKNLGLIIPFYRYPYIFNWDEQLLELIDLAKKNPSIPVIVIVNPHNGVGNSVDIAYRRAIKMLNGAGVFTIGYVALSYLNIEIERQKQNNPNITIQDLINRVKNEVLRWKQFYGHEILGIFFDEVPYIENQEQVDIINNLINFAKQNDILYTVGNPGTTLLPEYLKQLKFDNVVIYENTTLNLLPIFDGDWENSYREITKLKFSAILHGQQVRSIFENLNENYKNVIEFSKYFNYIYLTDDYQNHKLLKENFDLVNRLNNNDLINLIFNKKTYNVMVTHNSIYIYQYYVSSISGDDEKNDGKTPDKPFKTIERVFKDFGYNIINGYINIYLDEGEYDLSSINSQLLQSYNTSIKFYGKTELVRENIPFTVELVPDIDFDNMSIVKINADFSGINHKRCILQFINPNDENDSFYLYLYKPTDSYTYVETYLTPDFIQNYKLNIIEYKTIIRNIKLHDNIDYVGFFNIVFEPERYQFYLEFSGNKINFENCLFVRHLNKIYNILLDCNKVSFLGCKIDTESIVVNRDNSLVSIHYSIIENFSTLFEDVSKKGIHIDITTSRLIGKSNENSKIVSSNSVLSISSNMNKIKSDYLFQSGGIMMIDEEEFKNDKIPSYNFSNIISYINKLAVGEIKIISKNIKLNNRYLIQNNDTLLLINCTNNEKVIDINSYGKNLKDKILILRRIDNNHEHVCSIFSFDFLNKFEEVVLTPLNNNLILYYDGLEWNILNNYDGITGISQRLAINTNNYFSPYVKNACKFIEITLSANKIYFIPFILSENFKITNLGIEIINLLNLFNQDININVGIYNSRNNLPNKIILNSRETISPSNVGFISIEMNNNIAGLQKGVLYYLSISSDFEVKVKGVSPADTLINFGYDISTSNWISYYYLNSDTAELPDIVNRGDLYIGTDNLPFILIKGNILQEKRDYEEEDYNDNYLLP